MDQLHGLATSYIFPYLSKNIRYSNYSFNQYNTLFYLLKCGPQTISMIADQSSISHNAASKLVDSLVKNRMVRRVTDKKDHRKKWVFITTRGEKVLEGLRDLTISVYDRLLSGLSDELRAEFIEVLVKVNCYLPQDRPDIDLTLNKK
ncbi:MarR family transcriptional regulator [Seleniivibrio sp.]|uniref:MarR family winged helix-turn-helix transcriptional regulator n=1 Tax=Seleniivibrio sp. TaxID=2898801 RepID=UPI0025E0E024|nr:MarR family transcriptional regulator [Seleniivibrio sp.]MCD8554942.1 MarR family transcriptional regulator [Seleniivibrio sp.]